MAFPSRMTSSGKRTLPPPPVSSSGLFHFLLLLLLLLFVLSPQLISKVLRTNVRREEWETRRTLTPPPPPPQRMQKRGGEGKSSALIFTVARVVKLFLSFSLSTAVDNLRDKFARAALVAINGRRVQLWNTSEHSENGRSDPPLLREIKLKSAAAQAEPASKCFFLERTKHSSLTNRYCQNSNDV